MKINKTMKMIGSSLITFSLFVITDVLADTGTLASNITGSFNSLGQLILAISKANLTLGQWESLLYIFQFGYCFILYTSTTSLSGIFIIF